MVFTRFVETGRVAKCAVGKYKGRLVAIVNIIDQNRVLIDGPLSGVPRQQYPVNHLHLTKFRVKFPYTAKTKVVRKALEAFNVKEKFAETRWQERAKAKSKILDPKLQNRTKAANRRLRDSTKTCTHPGGE